VGRGGLVRRGGQVAAAFIKPRAVKE